MATYVNNLRLKEIATGAESGTWGTSTNTNLELIGEALGYGTEALADASTATVTIADGATDAARSIYLKLTGSLSQNCTVSLSPNTVSKVWFIENATSGGYSLIIKQGSGATVTISPSSTKCVATDGGGSGAIVYDVLTDLELAGSTLFADGAVGAPAIANTGDATTGLYFSGAGAMTFSSAGTGQFTINNGQILPVTTNDIDLGSSGVLFKDIYSAGDSKLTSITLNGVAITSTGTELNVLDGIPGTLTATELGYCDGVTSAIQTQLDSKLADPVIKATADSPYSLVNGDFIVVKNGSMTLTLPSGPSAGDNVTIKDGTGAAATTSFTVARNGSNIASAASDLTFDKNWAEITMTYIDGTIGWSV